MTYLEYRKHHGVFTSAILSVPSEIWWPGVLILVVFLGLLFYNLA